MASYFKPSLSPDKDAGWGLIYRLNNLWARVDTPAENGDYDAWNNVLDRIYCNLLYRNKIDIIKNEQNGEIIEVKINEEPHKIFTYLTKNIFQAKSNYLRTANARDKAIMRSRWYHKVLLKDVWLRKYMQELGLYLKEVANDPGSVLFGSGR
jgi:hypothetical protein